MATSLTSWKATVGKHLKERKLDPTEIFLKYLWGPLVLLCAFSILYGAIDYSKDISKLNSRALVPAESENNHVIVETEDIEPSKLAKMAPREPYLPYTDEEIDLVALVTMAEAEGECELGKRLVIDTILNRVDHPDFPDTVHDVIYQPSQFTSMWNGRVDKCYVKEDIRALVIEEMTRRTDSEPLYFRTGQYSVYGTPLYKIENHYFSGY